MDEKQRAGARMWRPKRKPVSDAEANRPRDDDARAFDEESERTADSPIELLRALRDKSRRSPALTGLGGALRDIATAAKDKVLDHANADQLLMHAMAGFIEAAASRYALDPDSGAPEWKPGTPLRVLLAGYNGTRNTGADVRVEEMIRQFRHLFGDDHIALSIFTLDPEKTRGYFRTVRQLHIPKVFPRFLFDTVHEQHAVVACEGSMFKSKFASALSTMMVGALGLAAAEQKLGVGYGGEAGAMEPGLRRMVKRYCQDALIIARNENSRTILKELGVASRAGTDTAWTFLPAPAEEGERILREAGWDGETPVMALCPINPFWWPVKPNVGRAMANAVSGIHDDAHYGSVYFHAAGPEVAERQERYLDALAEGARRFRQRHDVFPIYVGSEMLDRDACEGLRDRLGDGAVIVSDEHDMFAMVSVMRRARLMVSSRYHAIVTSMPGSVPSAGVTMDERIRNLMVDRGTPELALEVDDPNLADGVERALHTLWDDADRVRVGIDDCVERNLVRMGEMGMHLVEFVRKHHPDFPFREGMGLRGDAWDHLPSLSGEVGVLVDRVRARRARQADAAGTSEAAQ